MIGVVINGVGPMNGINLLNKLLVKFRFLEFSNSLIIPKFKIKYRLEGYTFKSVAYAGNRELLRKKLLVNILA